MQMSRFWFFPHDALQTVSNNASPIPLSFWILRDILQSLNNLSKSSTMQFVWPDMLLKWLIDKTNGHRKRIPLRFWTISSFFLDRGSVVLKEVYVFYGTRDNYVYTFTLNLSSQGATLNFIAWKKLFIFIATWLHTDKCFFQIFSMVINNLLQTCREVYQQEV